MADMGPPVRVYECADCITSFVDRQSLAEHIMRTHMNGKQFDPDNEHDYEPSTDSLDEDEDEDDEDGEEEDDDDYELGDDPVNASSKGRYHCRYCSKAFHRSFCLKRHERRHTGEKPFRCKDCGKKFSDRSNLLQHERSRHAEARTYVCTDCLKQFAQYNYLRRHLRSVHRQKLSFICPEPCNHAFVTEQAWIQHLRTHRNNVKPITVNGPWPCKGSKTKIPGQPSFPTATRKETAGGYRQNPVGDDVEGVALVRPVAMKAFGNQTAASLLSQAPAAIPHGQADWAPSDQGTFNALPDDHFHVGEKPGAAGKSTANEGEKGVKPEADLVPPVVEGVDQPTEVSHAL